MAKMDRRSFARSLSLGGLAYLGFRLTGCGPTGGPSGVAEDSPSAAASETLYDLQMEGWSTLGSGFLGKTGVLKATQIQANQTITLSYVQDPHGHEFTLTPEHFAKLRQGQAISVLTTIAEGHQHEVKIDPVKNRIPGTALEVPSDPILSEPGVEPAEKLYATLDEAETPSLYMAGSEELKAESIEFCPAAKDQCASDATLWQRMKVHGPASGRQVFVSERTLVLDPALAEMPLSMRARTKAADKLVQRLFKLVRQ